ncbi:hypothetical protein [Nocardiopsis synnemataformans]|uniref:hypothetical protein n=1 Tax=Nocardiopsis synnemataformans TaxID=61305 RepID=UPI003EBBEBC1
MSSQATTALLELAAQQEARYRTAAQRTQSPVYARLAERAARVGAALSGPAPVDTLRSLSWTTANPAVADLMEDVANVLEGAR